MFGHISKIDFNYLSSGDILTSLMITVLIIPSTFYHFIMQYFWDGASVGKKIMHIKVMNIDGYAASLSQILIRNLLCITNIGLGIVCMLILNPFAILQILILLSILATPDIISIIANKKNQKLGDMAAGTIVINTKSEIDINKTIFVDFNKSENYHLTYDFIYRLNDDEINGLQKILNNYKGFHIDYLLNIALKIESKLEQSRQEIEIDEYFAKLINDYNYYHQSK